MSELVSVIALPLTIFVFLSVGAFVSSSIIGVKRVCDANQTKLSAEEITHVEVIYLQSTKCSKRPLRSMTQKSDVSRTGSVIYIYELLTLGKLINPSKPFSSSVK